MSPPTLDLAKAIIGDVYVLKDGTFVEYVGTASTTNINGRIYCFRNVAGGSEMYRTRTGLFSTSGDPDPERDILQKIEEDFPPATEKVNLSISFLGQQFVLRNGAVVRFKSRVPTRTGMDKWPFTVGDEQYTSDGFYMSKKSPHPKDIVRILPAPKKKTPLCLRDVLHVLSRGPKRFPGGKKTRGKLLSLIPNQEGDE